jgi:hypothetical protein
MAAKKITLIAERSLSPDRHALLRKKLDAYYAKPKGYTAFQKPSRQPDWWHLIAEAIRRRCTAGEKVRVLEVGAGMSGFAGFLEELEIRAFVELHAHDVTDHNLEWLRSVTDHVHIGEISQIDLPVRFDIIFSTYVLEHVSNPSIHLETLWSKLMSSDDTAGGGSLFLISPRYDLIGYLCPSSHHQSPLSKLLLLLTQLEARCRTLITKKPQFLIETDPSVFHRPFFLDADAVHWVSLLDLRAWACSKGSVIRKLQSPPTPMLSKQWIIRNYATLAIEIRRS